uniref:Uncharacterized protein n=1 Tax=Glyptapanteles flavicoxis TaxID=463051 RepID=B7S873_9HYME|nr:conserved hypothetical protein [Glyptapanteles flavicoxis]
MLLSLPENKFAVAYHKIASKVLPIEMIYFFKGAKSTTLRNLSIKREKRDTGEQTRRVIYGINSREVQNNFGLIKSTEDGGGLNSGVSVVTGPNVNQTDNSFSNIHQAQSVYVVLPNWYKIENYQAPDIAERTEGDRISSERSQTIQRMITFLTDKVTDLENQSVALAETHNLNTVYVPIDDPKKNLKNRLSVLILKLRTLVSRLNYQQERLNQFNNIDSKGLQDIFDRDFGHLTLVVEITQLDLLDLTTSFNS